MATRSFRSAAVQQDHAVYEQPDKQTQGSDPLLQQPDTKPFLKTQQA
jgi:hypothetical protein